MKKLLIAFIILCLTSQITFAQWMDDNPATLDGDALMTGNFLVGATFYPANPARINLYKQHSGAYPSGTPLSVFTTGMKFTHRYSPSGSGYQNYNWDLAVDDRRMYFHYANLNQTIMSIGKNGQVGIGVTHTDATLHVDNINANGLDAHLEGFTLIDGNQGSLLLGAETGAAYGEWGIEYNPWAKGLNFWKPAGSMTGLKNYLMFISDTGNVSIGTDDAKGYKLAVKGDMIAEEIVVKLCADWPDFVFTKKYGLMPLKELEAFIEKHSHLPNIPSAKEVQKEGIKVGEMNRLLLQKIEELTLYVIDLEKKVEALENK